MHVIAKRTLREFWTSGHASAEQPMKAWHALVEAATWNGPADIKRAFPHASFLARNRVVFNIGGNKYRLVVKVVYETGRVYVRFVGTHADYDRIDANEV